jgi:hypothetical protein
MGTKEASTWRDPKLAKALTFRNAGYWNQAWAESNLLGGGAKYLAVTEFLDLSAREQVSEREAETARHQKELDDARALAESERQRRRWLTIAASLGLFVIVAGLTTVYFMERSRDLEVQRKADQALLGAEQARANEAIALFDRQIQRNKELLAALEGLQKESGSAARERQRLSAEVAKLRLESNDLARQRVEAEREKERVYGDIKNKGFNPDQIRQSRPAATAN